MNDFMLASMLLSLVVVSAAMVLNQHRENLGKKSLTHVVFHWISKKFA